MLLKDEIGEGHKGYARTKKCHGGVERCKDRSANAKIERIRFLFVASNIKEICNYNYTEQSGICQELKAKIKNFAEAESTSH